MEIVKLSKKHIFDVAKLKETVKNGMDNKEMFAIGSLDGFRRLYEKGAVSMFGCFDQGRLVAEFCYSIPDDGMGYGAYSGLLVEPGTVAHMDSCAVLLGYRGHGLQRRMILAAEEDILELRGNVRNIFAIVHPENAPSIKSLESCGYERVVQWDDMPVPKHEELKRVLFYKCL